MQRDFRRRAASVPGHMFHMVHVSASGPAKYPSLATDATNAAATATRRVPARCPVVGLGLSALRGLH